MEEFTKRARENLKDLESLLEKVEKYPDFLSDEDFIGCLKDKQFNLFKSYQILNSAGNNYFEKLNKNEMISKIEKFYDNYSIKYEKKEVGLELIKELPHLEEIYLSKLIGKTDFINKGPYFYSYLNFNEYLSCAKVSFKGFLYQERKKITQLPAKKHILEKDYLLSFHDSHNLMLITSSINKYWGTKETIISHKGNEELVYWMPEFKIPAKFYENIRRLAPKAKLSPKESSYFTISYPLEQI